MKDLDTTLAVASNDGRKRIAGIAHLYQGLLWALHINLPLNCGLSSRWEVELA
jgi:hypothetical protein